MLNKVKMYLKITWTFEDELLQRFIENGQAYLNGLTGTELDYISNRQAQAFLLDYCRYAYNNGLEFFVENFRNDILRMQLSEAVKKRAEKQAEGGA